jgi:hypothetical protein
MAFLLDFISSGERSRLQRNKKRGFNLFVQWLAAAGFSADGSWRKTRGTNNAK